MSLTSLSSETGQLTPIAFGEDLFPESLMGACSLSKVTCVPVVIVEMWEGRTVEQKEKLIKGITQAFEESLGTRPESLHIVIHDVPKTNWGTKGEQASKLPS